MPGVATLGGVTYNDLNGLSSWDSLFVTLSGPSLPAPTVTGGSVVLTAPVTLGGAFRHVPDGATLPVVDTLVGSGTAFLTLNHQDPNLWNAGTLRVEFGPTAVTPEPASLLLLGSGLALLITRRVRTRGRSSRDSRH